MNTALSPPPPEQTRRHLTIEEVADVYARPESFVRAWVKCGRLPSLRLGPRIIRVAWKDVVEQYCGVPCVDLTHPDDSADRRWRRAMADEAARRASLERRVVYFVQGKRSKLIKIGIADDPRRRLQGLRTQNAESLQVLAMMPGYLKEERELHRRFASARSHGEWFRPIIELRQFIDGVLREYQLPEWAA